MSENIVSRETVKKVLGRTTEAVRMLLDEGLSFDNLQIVIDDPVQRSRLVRYWRAGAPEVNVWPVWRTIKRNPVLNSSDAFLSALAEKGCKVSDWAKDILRKPDFAESLKEPEQKYNLFVLTTAQLTGKENTTSTAEEIFAGIERLDFQLCPAWVGPQLRLDYQDQPNNEWRYIAMKQILASDGDPHVFLVKRFDSDLWLHGNYADPGLVWFSGHLWVVCRPCK